MLSEFDLIQHYFVTPPSDDPRIQLGIGDDCALLQPSSGMQLAISSDMLVSGRHFFPDADPYLLGHKCLAVNLSDLAAMGAKPVAFTLALALPEANPAWLAPFSAGMLALANEHRCVLIGGDTTKGPLTISITIFGEIPPGKASRRDAAQVGDDIWISGNLGDARLALAHYWHELQLSDDDFALAAMRMHQPVPRIALGLALQGIAHAALDISDGLLGDLGHILKRSGAGASLHVDLLPAGMALRNQPREKQREFTLAGGDDYELCFTAPAELRAQVMAASAASATPVTRVGTIDRELGIRLLDSTGQLLTLPLTSFDHFRTP
ncbi:thiamine-phosphate kinase [Undibacterium sp. Jales W-56]|uniref:thiamine-phosphate kinase n=1 Tax=Undibacterium sp. Jales W-56 TaxID=2897325 RepID=UPI0021D2689E|nr:thiamine-phosphate kinase [Undibacterium sp. Jales W-56]MCU6432735.1 thiamine-phosphate kinase [Undibacterium sp. Jales W-56]